MHALQSVSLLTSCASLGVSKPRSVNARDRSMSAAGGRILGSMFKIALTCNSKKAPFPSFCFRTMLLKSLLQALNRTLPRLVLEKSPSLGSPHVGGSEKHACPKYFIAAVDQNLLSPAL